MVQILPTSFTHCVNRTPSRCTHYEDDRRDLGIEALGIRYHGLLLLELKKVFTIMVLNLKLKRDTQSYFDRHNGT